MTTLALPTITTPEDLAALAPGALVQELDCDEHDGDPEPFERLECGCCWQHSYYDVPRLPVRVLFDPAWPLAVAL